MFVTTCSSPKNIMQRLPKLGDYTAFIDVYRGQKYELQISDSASAIGIGADRAQRMAHRHIAEECAGIAPRAVSVFSDGTVRTQPPASSASGA